MIVPVFYILVVALVPPLLAKVRITFHIYYIDAPRENIMYLKNISKNFSLDKWKRLIDSHNIEDCIIKRKAYYSNQANGTTCTIYLMKTLINS